LALPYWDTALDARLSNPRDSVLFSTELMGSVDDNDHLTPGSLLARWRVFNFSQIEEQTELENLLKLENNGKREGELFEELIKRSPFLTHVRILA
jgi:hypothetical protein